MDKMIQCVRAARVLNEQGTPFFVARDILLEYDVSEPVIIKILTDYYEEYQGFES